MLKRSLAFALVLVLCLSLSACSSKENDSTASTEPTESSAATESSANETNEYVFKDSLGREITMEKNPKKVVVLFDSFTEMWEQAGGVLLGTTADALEEKQLKSENITVVGETIHEPSLETIVSLEPDFVVLSPDIEQHKALSESLDKVGIVNAFFKVEFFDDYLEAMKIMTDLTGDKEAYENNALAIKEQIDAVKKAAEGKEGPTVLYMRAMTSNIKAKGDDHHTGAMLKDLGCDNIVSRYDSLLDGISLEEVVKEDPDFIFYTTMGNDEKALAYLKENLESNPAFNSLSAVKNGRYIRLPKDMFHYKPNAKWGEAYQYLYDIIYGETE